MAIAEEMRRKLQASFAPEVLDVVDDSESHRGHSGYPEGGESHFNLRLSAAPFADMSRLARHRAVHAALGDDIIARIHALSIEFV